MDSKSKPFAHQDWSEDFFMPKKSTAKTAEKRVADAMKGGGSLVATKKGKIIQHHFNYIINNIFNV